MDVSAQIPCMWLSEQHHYNLAFTTEDIAVPMWPAVDIFDELIYESFRRTVLTHRPVKIGGEMRCRTAAASQRERASMTLRSSKWRTVQRARQCADGALR